MPVGRFYAHDGQNFMDELIDPIIANMIVYEFRGRGQGVQHMPFASTTFEYNVQEDRLLITMQGATLEFILGENRESFWDSFGMTRYAIRR